MVGKSGDREAEDRANCKKVVSQRLSARGSATNCVLLLVPKTIVCGLVMQCPFSGGLP